MSIAHGYDIDRCSTAGRHQFESGSLPFESAVRDPGIDVDDALEMAEQTDV